MIGILTAALLSFSFPTGSGLVEDDPGLPMYVTTSDYSRIHSVAVLSAIGLNLEWDDKHLHPGDTPDIGAWKLDAYVEEVLRSKLSGRFAFKTVAYNPADLLDLTNDPRWRDQLQAAYVAKLNNSGVDAYFLIKPATPIIDFPRDNGLGASDGSPPFVWAFYRVTLVDAHTGKTLADGLSRIPLSQTEHDFFEIKRGPPYARWHSRNNDTVNAEPTPAQWDALGVDMKALLDLSLRQTLVVLKLDDEPLP